MVNNQNSVLNFSLFLVGFTLLYFCVILILEHVCVHHPCFIHHLYLLSRLYWILQYNCIEYCNTAVQYIAVQLYQILQYSCIRYCSITVLEIAIQLYRILQCNCIGYYNTTISDIAIQLQLILPFFQSSELCLAICQIICSTERQLHTNN